MQNILAKRLKVCAGQTLYQSRDRKWWKRHRDCYPPPQTTGTLSAPAPLPSPFFLRLCLQPCSWDPLKVYNPRDNKAQTPSFLPLERPQSDLPQGLCTCLCPGCSSTWSPHSWPSSSSGLSSNISSERGLPPPEHPGQWYPHSTHHHLTLPHSHVLVSWLTVIFTSVIILGDTNICVDKCYSECPMLWELLQYELQ